MNETSSYKTREGIDMTETTLTRKSFITGAGAALLSAAAMGLAGCGNATGEASVSAADGIAWDEEYDVIVVGSGIAGTAAAVTVATEGDGATCLLLEKSGNPLGGGNTQFSAGAILATRDAAAALSYLKALRGENPTVSDDVLEAYANGMAEHAAWFKALGTEDFYEPWEPGAKKTSVSGPEYPELCASGEDRSSIGCILFNGGDGSGFKHPQAFLSNIVDDRLDVITRKTDSPATTLIQDPTTKEILGITYEAKGKPVNARANKGVIMCCGGFENNPDMMANYLRSYGSHPLAGVHNTGDGITMCAQVGASMWHMANIAGFYNGFASIDGTKFSGKNAAQTLRGEGIIVGPNGRRYYMDNGSLGNKELTDDDLRIHVGYRHGDVNHGGEWMHQHLPSTSWYVFDQAGFDAGATAELEESDPVASGWGYSASTIAELAKTVCFPEGELEATVDTWNAMCDQGKDTAFYRFPNTLNKIETPPFYAMRMVPFYLNTDGGPVRSSKGEVLGLDGNPIPHLYSSGEFGSIWSDMYNAGGNLSEGMTFSRLAVRTCLDLGN